MPRSDAAPGACARRRPGRPRGRHRRPPARRGCGAGYATAETAVALPAVAVVTVSLMWGMSALTTQLRCVAAARDAARAVARGGDGPEAVAAARRAGPAGARVTTGYGTGGLVRVHVAAVSPGLRIPVSADAAAEPEQAPPAPPRQPAPQPPAPPRPPARPADGSAR